MSLPRITNIITKQYADFHLQIRFMFRLCSLSLNQPSVANIVANTARFCIHSDIVKILRPAMERCMILGHKCVELRVNAFRFLHHEIPATMCVRSASVDCVEQHSYECEEKQILATLVELYIYISSMLNRVHQHKQADVNKCHELRSANKI